MKLRMALTLVTLFLAGLVAGSALQPSTTFAQGGIEPRPQPIDEGVAFHVARPRAAVLSVFHSGAESFLLAPETDELAPVRLEARTPKLRLRADYEALFLPLTAGWARYHLAAYLLEGGERELLAEDGAELVDFGPGRHGGRLNLDIKLAPGLHRVALVAKTESRAVGVSEWTTDQDSAVIWVLVAGDLAGDLAGEDLAVTSAVASIAPAYSSSDGIDQNLRPGVALPVGGMAAGSQRGVVSADSGGAINYEAQAGSSFIIKVGDVLPVWSDYELWWAEGAEGDASAVLQVGPDSNAAGGIAPGDTSSADRFGLEDVEGPRLEDGSLRVGLSFAQAGTYRMQAQLVTRVRQGDMVFEDHDSVPFTVNVVPLPPTTGEISGIVYSAEGIVLEGVTILATDMNGAPIARTRSNADGRYRLDGLSPGKFLVKAMPAPFNYLDQWFRGSPSMQGATGVPVQAGKTAEGIDFKLTPGGTISGRVTDASGKPLGGIEISAGVFSDEAIQPRVPSSGAANVANAIRTRTNDEGYFSISRLPEGRYWVRARDPEGRFPTEYFDDARTLEDAEKVPVQHGQNTEGIDFVLGTAGAITGQVREETVLGVIIPLGGMKVEARGIDDPEHVHARTMSKDDGKYRLGGLREGRYLVRASDPQGNYLAEWYKDAETPADAEPVGVATGQVVENINFTLAETPARTRVFVDPARTGLQAGSSGRVAIAVEDVENLGSFESELRWDPAIIQVDEVILSGFLGSTGREVIPVEPEIDNDQGLLRYASASIGRIPGPSGDGQLFEVRFTALERGETDLEVSDSILTSPDAGVIDHVRGNGHIVVGACMFADFDCNCRIDIRDVMEVVSRWGTMEGDPDYDATFDLDADGDIDIVDVQIVGGLWGQVCTGEPDPNRPLDGGNEASAGAAGLDAKLPVAPKAPDAARLVLSASDPAPAVGAFVEVFVEVEEAAELTGYELTVDYDPALLRFASGEQGEFLGSTGRNIVPLGPMDSDGQVTIGAGSLPGYEAPSGEGRLAILRFEVLAAGQASLDVAEAIIVDEDKNASNIGGGGVVVDAGGEAPVTHLGFVPMVVTRGR